MKNETSPLQNTTTVREVKLRQNTRIETVVELAPNRFED